MKDGKKNKMHRFLVRMKIDRYCQQKRAPEKVSFFVVFQHYLSKGFYDSAHNSLFIQRMSCSLRMHSPSHARGILGMPFCSLTTHFVCFANLFVIEWLHCREQEYISYGIRIGKQHYKSVHADSQTARWGHAVFERI